MAAEYTAVGNQTVQPGQAVVFTGTTIPCNLGLVNHADETPTFVLTGSKCRRRRANYFVDFGANIAVPEGGTVGPISVAFAVDGAPMPVSQMIVTPAAAGDFFNANRAMTVPIFSGCCQTLTVVNTSDIPIEISNANIVIDRPDLR
jgi:hypothetical protein